MEIFGWFPKKNRNRLERLIAEHQVKSVIEIGTFLGLSAKFFAERVDSVTCIDTFETVDEDLSGVLANLRLPNAFFDAFKQNMIEAGVWHKITALQGRSNQMADQVQAADLVYIDADHSHEGCASDIQFYLPKAAKIICGDDYKNEYPGVKDAVTRLLPGYQSEGHFWWYIK